MNEADALELMRLAVWTIVVASAPAVAAAMIVGLGVAVFQTLTQIQEATLTFVPKIIAVFLAMMLSASFVGAQVYAFSELAYARIERGF
ncbi:MAG: flagellar biosynthetic protein FliQ [Hyphomicrobiales bacterium]|nr:flagellar biosynthetic protein FliQ [Hyphomicrobiales bacterium]